MKLLPDLARRGVFAIVCPRLPSRRPAGRRCGSARADRRVKDHPGQAVRPGPRGFAGLPTLMS
jgi:hypothetical protein